MNISVFSDCITCLESMSLITFHRSHTTMDSNGRKFAIPRNQGVFSYSHSRPINSCLSKPACRSYNPQEERLPYATEN